MVVGAAQQVLSYTHGLPSLPLSLPLQSSSHNFQSRCPVTDVRPSQRFLFKSCIIEFSGNRIVLQARHKLQRCSPTLHSAKDLVARTRAVASGSIPYEVTDFFQLT
jgi:hypothetical protein